MPLYLFQVSAHSRPVALQRKPRYCTLSERKGRGCFRERVSLNTCTDFFSLSLSFPFPPSLSLFPPDSGLRCKPGWQHQTLRWRLGGTFLLRAFQTLNCSHIPPTWSGVESTAYKRGVEEEEEEDAASGCCIVKESSLMNQLGSWYHLTPGFLTCEGRYREARMYSSGSIKAPNIISAQCWEIIQLLINVCFISRH